MVISGNATHPTFSLDYKVYVEVGAIHYPSGKITPLWIRWTDGRKFAIDQVRGCVRAASKKVGGAGLRYTITICGRTTYLFYDFENRWFVEAKDPQRTQLHTQAK